MHFSQVILLAACSLVVACSTPVVRTAKSSSEGGLAYYLPKRNVRLIYDRDKPEDALAAATSKAQAALKAAQTEQQAAQSALDSKKKLVAALAGAKPVDEKALQEATLAVAVATVELATAQEKVVKATNNATKAQGNLDDALKLTDACGFVERFSANLSPYVADSSQRYVARLSHRITREESLVLKTTRSGLLTTSDATATDQSGAIIVALARSIGAFRAAPLRVQPNSVGTRAGPPRATPAPAGVSYEDFCPFVQPVHYETTLDPTKSEPLTALQTHLGARFETMNNRACEVLRTKYAVQWIAAKGNCNDFLGPLALKSSAYELKSTPELATATDISCKEKTKPSSDMGCSGLVYRRELPVTIDVLRDHTPLVSFDFEIPNASPVERIAMDAGPFVKTKHNFVFESGMLVSVDSTRPSEALTAAEAPFNAIGALLKATADVVQFKVDLRNKENTLSAADKAAIEAQIALLEAERKLKEAQVAAASDADAK